MKKRSLTMLFHETNPLSPEEELALMAETDNGPRPCDPEVQPTPADAAELLKQFIIHNS